MNSRAIVLLIFVTFFVSACARYPKLNEAGAIHDSEIDKNSGRVVFMKDNNVGEHGKDGGEIMLALLSGTSSDRLINYEKYSKSLMAN